MRRLIITLILTISTLSICQASGSRQIINLNNDWQFAPGWKTERTGDIHVTLPHTWNGDALSGDTRYYRGTGGYLKQIDVPDSWRDKRVFIKFGGANQTATLFVNGRYVGTHKGGYTSFIFDISSFLKLGEKNAVWVGISNAKDYDVMPLAGDFNVYGGLHRGVELIVTPNVYIDPEQFNGAGVVVTPKAIDTTKATMNVRFHVGGNVGELAEISYIIRAANDSIVMADKFDTPSTLARSGGYDADFDFEIDNPTLWNSVENPHLYRLELRVRKHSAPNSQSDCVTVPFGVRFFDIDNKTKFMLNGRPFAIRGVVHHGDWTGVGTAAELYRMEQDIALMLEMGVNAVRFANHPPCDQMLQLCDRAGIIVWSELPFVGPGRYRDTGFCDSDAFRSNGKEQLSEIIHQQMNHPSVIFRGLFNEVAQNGDDPVPYIKELNALAKELDPSRPTIAASNQDGSINFITDLIGFNKSYGWTSGQPSDIRIWSRSLGRDWSNLKVALSAYGAGANPAHQTIQLQKPDNLGHWHPEQWQAYFHEEHYAALQQSVFWGTFIDAMFDYGSTARQEGQMNGIGNEGLVTFDRATKKDVFYFYKAVWNTTDPFVYIANRRLTSFAAGTHTIKVYSNQSAVTLYVDGVAIAENKPDSNGIFTWEINLSAGSHSIVATASESTPSDQISVTVRR